MRTVVHRAAATASHATKETCGSPSHNVVLNGSFADAAALCLHMHHSRVLRMAKHHGFLTVTVAFRADWDWARVMMRSTHPDFDKL